MALEPRLLLHAGEVHEPHDFLAQLATFPSYEVSPEGTDTTAGGTGVAVGATGPLVVPALASLAGAAASLYLDFDGYFEAQWGSYSNITTPAFDQDGDATTFSDAELSAINLIWQQVAEDYAPFAINVTTVLPASFANGVAERIAIGGDGAWYGAGVGGVSYVDSFTNFIANTAYVFAKNMANGVAKYTAEAVSHEAGHAFGLHHQSLYSGTTKTAEYSQGSGDGRAPIMGNSYSAERGLWWSGQSSISATTIQDDMAVLARETNRFGYRADDRGDTASTATPLAVSGTQATGSGVITTTSDADYFSFTTGAGTITLWVDVPAGINNLDALLELRDAGGGLIASADPSTGFGATLTADVTAGSYGLVVRSHGSYGDVGQYTVGATIVAPTSSPVAAPTGLSASVNLTGQVLLTWADVAGETGYGVERSTDGVTWTQVASLEAGSTSYTDAATTAGQTYSYRVRAWNDSSTSDYSNQATATIAPNAPTSLTATAFSATRVDLTWADVAGETGYRVERSTDGGGTWTPVGNPGADVRSYRDTSAQPGVTYHYRLLAINAGGESAPSNTAAATTPAAVTVPAAPSGLTATATSGQRVSLSWNDNSSNETGFRIERSTNGGGTWSRLAQVGANVASYVDTTVSKRKSYQYRVIASNGAGDSTASNVAAVTTPSRSGAPDGGLLAAPTGPDRPDDGDSSTTIRPVEVPDTLLVDLTLEDWSPRSRVVAAVVRGAWNPA